MAMDDHGAMPVVGLGKFITYEKLIVVCLLFQSHARPNASVNKEVITARKMGRLLG